MNIHRARLATMIASLTALVAVLGAGQKWN
jgi:hypothetical protein